MSSLDPAAFLGIALVGAGGPGPVIALSVVLVGALEGDSVVFLPRGGPDCLGNPVTCRCRKKPTSPSS